MRLNYCYIVAESSIQSYEKNRLEFESVKKKERERKRVTSDDGMKNVWNYHGICITTRFQTRG